MADIPDMFTSMVHHYKSHDHVIDYCAELLKSDLFNDLLIRLPSNSELTHAAKTSPD